LNVVLPNATKSQKHFFQCPVIEDISLKAHMCIGTFIPDNENESNFEMLGVKNPKQMDIVQNNRLPYSTDSINVYLAKNAASGSLLVFMSICKHLCTSPSRK
jgi:hypothetical protein